MTLIAFTKLIFRNWKTILLSGLIAVSGVYYLTRDQKKVYTSKMVLNTGVVSGYNIENHDSDSRIDRDYTRNELENLISLATAYETQEELAMHLLAHYIRLKEADPQWISEENFQELQLSISKDFKKLVIDSSLETTLEKIRLLKAQDRSNPVYSLIYSDHPFFGLEHLQQIKVHRKGASDLLEFTYSTEDPAVCKQTLSTLAEIFISRHRLLKERQSEDVLGFFEEATKKSAAKLSAAEEKLLKFQVENNIINYYEQTRFIADKKEDLDELFFQEVMDLEGTRSALKRLEEQMEGRIKISELNQLFLDKRSEITQVANGLAEKTLLAENQNLQQKEVLRQRLQNLEGEVKELARTSFELDQTPEGIATDELLSNWLKAVINLEESGSRLAVIKDRKQEFKEIYSQFAPWGSSLKKIEREIALAEDAYLENLHSYNQARLHLQNTTMTGSLHLMDAPYFPTKEGASKRLILLIVAFLVGLMLPLTLLIAIEFLDQTLKHPLRASETIGLPLLGAYPSFPYRKNSGPSGVDFPSIRKRTTRLIQQQLLRTTNNETSFWSFCSTRGKEGVSFIIGLQAAALRGRGKKVLVLIPNHQDTNQSPIVPHEDTQYYQTAALGTLLEKAKTQSWDYVLVELPALLSGELPVLQDDYFDQGVLICSANRVWAAADQQGLEQLNFLAKNQPCLVMNNTPIPSLDTVLGEVPRTRSRMRVQAKRILSFNFSSNPNL